VLNLFECPRSSAWIEHLRPKEGVGSSNLSEGEAFKILKSAALTQPLLPRRYALRVDEIFDFYYFRDHLFTPEAQFDSTVDAAAPESS
jgi:hypothetical protein